VPANSSPALIPSDRRQPGCRVARLRPAKEASVRRDERLLRGILGLVVIAQEEPAEPEHHACVLVEQQSKPSCHGSPVHSHAGAFCSRSGQDATPGVE
jgi:hypothetical protein